MALKKECLLYLELEKMKLIEEYPKYKLITEELFVQINDFMNNDFDGVSENKIYRLFLEKLKHITQYALNSGVSKAYMRNFFKKLNNRSVLEYLTGIMKTKSTDIKSIMGIFVNSFVYWQASDVTKDQKAEEIIRFVDSLM